MDKEPPDTEYPEDFKANVKLHRAAKKGQVARLRRLCKSGINPDGVNEQHQSPLFVAALHGRVKAVKFLLASGANPNHPCYDGSTPMHAACLACCPHVVCLLADAGGNDAGCHDNRGLLPRDWVSYQEDIDRRFRMRKFLEAMRLYREGPCGDQPLSAATRSRWRTLVDYVRQVPERSRKRWRRRRWFREPSRRPFRPAVRRRVSGCFQRLRAVDCSSSIACWELLRHRSQEGGISQRDTLPSQDAIKIEGDIEHCEGAVLVNANYNNPEIDINVCQLQLSDSKYPVQTLFVDEKDGKLLSSKRADNVRQPILSEIEEEWSSQGSSGSCHRKEAMMARANKAKAKILLCDDCKCGHQGKREVGDQHPRAAVATERGQEPEGDAKTEATRRDAPMGEADGAAVGTRIGEGASISAEKDPHREPVTILEILQADEPRTHEGESLLQDTEAREEASSSSTDDSCKNKILEILEDAFKMELAPGVSELMKGYCDSTQGSNAAAESFDIDFHSYHGDDDDGDVEDAEIEDEVQWIGTVDDESSSGSEDLNDNCDAGVAPTDHHSPGETRRSDDAMRRAELEIDRLLNGSGSEISSEEDDRNFIMEGRYVDIQKMLSATLDVVFPEAADTQRDTNGNDEEMAEKEGTPDAAECSGSISLGNTSSLYRVSALDEAAFISDLSLEVNVTNSRKSSPESSPTQDQGEGPGSQDATEGTVEELGTSEWNDTPLHSALARMDLTKEERREVQEWFGGHGSVRNLIQDYETRLRGMDEGALRSNVTSLGALLRREFANLGGAAGSGAESLSTTTESPRRSVSDTLATQQQRDSHLQPQRNLSDTTHEFTPEGKSSNIATPQVVMATERSYDESWLWPGSGDDEETLEEQLRRSMADIVDVQCDDDDGDQDRQGPPESGRGDAEKIVRAGDSPALVSPPPPSCTPEEGSSPRPTPEDQADTSLASKVNNSGDCEVVSAQDGQSEQILDHKPAAVDDQQPPTCESPTTSRGAIRVGVDLSPQSEATKKLVKIEVMRSPTVEAIHITSV